MRCDGFGGEAARVHVGGAMIMAEVVALADAPFPAKCVNDLLSRVVAPEALERVVGYEWPGLLRVGDKAQ